MVINCVVPTGTAIAEQVSSVSRGISTPFSLLFGGLDTHSKEQHGLRAILS